MSRTIDFIQKKSDIFTKMVNISEAFHDEKIVGEFHRFGENGPIYRVLNPTRVDEKGDWLLQIEVPTTGEIAEYPYSQIITDPIAK